MLPRRPPGAQRFRTSQPERAERQHALAHLASSRRPPARSSPTRSPQGPLPPSPSLAILPDALPNPTARCRPTSPRFSPVSRVRSRCPLSSHACGQRDVEQQLARREPPLVPLGPRGCSCRGPFDEYSDHRATCATSGILASRAVPIERAIARVCQETGACFGPALVVTLLWRP